MFLIIFLIFLQLISGFPGFALQIGDSCSMDRTGHRGTCKMIPECPTALAEYARGTAFTKCGLRGPILIICCKNPEETTTTTTTESTYISGRFNLENLRISERKCVEYSKYVYENLTIGTPTGDIVKLKSRCGSDSIPYISGGTLAKPREFPHMALLGTVDKNEPNGIKWICGGSLISENFVLSAAHCFQSDDVDIRIRLGDLNYASMEDEARPITLGIKRTISHPNYTALYHDIGLLELERSVEFNPYMRPICLPSPDIDLSAETEVTVTGWGTTGYTMNASTSLLKAGLDLFTYSECNSTWGRARLLRRGIIDEEQICAGSRTDNKDACEGDSGGPLQIFFKPLYCMHTVIGITSFGKICGRPNQSGIYTRVSHYIDWIENIVWPSS